MTLRYVTLHYNYIQDASTCIFTLRVDPHGCWFNLAYAPVVLWFPTPLRWVKENRDAMKENKDPNSTPRKARDKEREPQRGEEIGSTVPLATVGV